MAVPFLNFFQKPANELEKGGRPAPVNQDENEPSQTCPNCHRAIPLSLLWDNFNCCIHCGHHFRLNARQRISMLADPDSFQEHDAGLCAGDLLQFPGYPKKLETARTASGELEAVICGDFRNIQASLPITPEEIAVSIAGELICCRALRRAAVGNTEKE